MSNLSYMIGWGLGIVFAIYMAISSYKKEGKWRRWVFLALFGVVLMLADWLHGSNRSIFNGMAARNLELILGAAAVLVLLVIAIYRKRSGAPRIQWMALLLTAITIIVTIFFKRVFS